MNRKVKSIANCQGRDVKITNVAQMKAQHAQSYLNRFTLKSNSEGIFTENLSRYVAAMTVKVVNFKDIENRNSCTF